MAGKCPFLSSYISPTLFCFKAWSLLYSRYLLQSHTAYEAWTSWVTMTRVCSRF